MLSATQPPSGESYSQNRDNPRRRTCRLGDDSTTDAVPDRAVARGRASATVAEQTGPAPWERPHLAGGSLTLGPEYFDAFYQEHGDDPWGFADRWYEQRKRAVLMATLPRPRFARAFEPGCSIGMLTEQLAHRCDEVLAIDVSAQAVRTARERTAHLPGVRVERASILTDAPDGFFDLIVLSEVGYYLGLDDLRVLVHRLAARLSGDGVLAACHWRHPVDEYPLDGDTVHEELRRHPRLGLLARHVEEDFILDVLTTAPTVSVARATGVFS